MTFLITKCEVVAQSLYSEDHPLPIYTHWPMWSCLSALEHFFSEVLSIPHISLSLSLLFCCSIYPLCPSQERDWYGVIHFRWMGSCTMNAHTRGSLFPIPVSQILLDHKLEFQHELLVLHITYLLIEPPNLNMGVMFLHMRLRWMKKSSYLLQSRD